MMRKKSATKHHSLKGMLYICRHKPSDMESEIKKIVLTGGPCAGKTTALVKIMDHFTSRGFKVFTIPEVPTMFLQAGMDYLTPNEAFFYEGEKATLEMQLALEDKFTRIARACGERAFIVCDRGAMDISTYLTPQQWADITQAVGVDPAELREHRYDAVLHLVSAADGAEKYYTTATNLQRTEGIEKARRLDKKIIGAWNGHPHLRVINNHENFDNKLNRVIKEISNVLGLPQPIEEERKYIVELNGDIPDSVDSDIVQTYLVADPGVEARLRHRSWNGKDVYVLTTKKPTAQNEQIETERQITKNVYESLLQQADPYRHTIRKRRSSFIWKGQYFELDHFTSPLQGLTILETKGVGANEEIRFPPFLNIVREITGNEAFYNYNIALKRK